MALGDHLNVKIHACLGGKSMQEDIRKLQMGVHMVSGTPGRVYDMIQQRYLDLRKLKMLILDEADEMLKSCLLYTSPSPRDLSTSRMPSSA